MKKTLAN